MTTASPPGLDPSAPERQRRITWRSVLFTLVLIPAAVAVPVLGYQGATILRNEDTGRVIGAEADANEPGFEALVTPTPTQLVVMRDDVGTVSGVQVLALTDPSGGGSVVSLPVATFLEVAFLDTPTKPLDELDQVAGVDGLEQRLETVFTAGMAEVVEVTPDQWVGLIEPVGTISVDNPSAFTGVKADGTLGQAFEAGSITLAPDQVADFILLEGEGELDTVRNDRQIAFWQGWINSVAEAGGDAVPGEVDRGLGRFVRGLAAGTSSVVPLPVEQIPIPGIAAVDSNVFAPDQPAVDTLSVQIIPFPVGVGRLRTRLIDGVGDVSGLKARAASVLVAAGAEITVIGNAETFGESSTTVVYFRRDDQEMAQALADAIGGDLQRGDSTNETVDVVVLIGQDFADSDEQPVDPPADDDGGTIEITPPTAVPTDGDESTPGIAPGAPGGD